MAATSPTPVTNGQTVHLAGLLRQLRHRHDVHVVCYGDAFDVEGVSYTLLPLPDVPPRWRTVTDSFRGLVDGVPATVRRNQRGGIHAAVHATLANRQFDVGHIVGSGVGFVGFGTNLPWLLGVIDSWQLAHGELIKLAKPSRRPLMRITTTTGDRWERRLMRTLPMSVTSSEADRRVLLELDPTSRVEVLPNGVDTVSLSPAKALKRTPGLIAFHGTMDFPPNVAGASVLAKEVFPRVRDKVPDARLRLIGRDPVDSVRALAGDGVEVTGPVKDMAASLSEACVYACAVWHGSGVKNKLLEAAALGLPIVSTTMGLGSLAFQDDRQLLIRDSVEEMAEGLVQLLVDPEARARLGQSARLVVEQLYTWNRVAEQYCRLYEELQA